MPDSGDVTVALADRRTLGVREFGDPHGFPVFYFHGHPGSRADFAFIDPNAVAQQTGTRVLALDRPGYGLSTPHPDRTLLDWPGDVLAVADHLGIRRFAVLGYSGGGPYAAACAASLPRQRLTSAAIISGVGPAGSPGQSHSPGWFMYTGAPKSLRGSVVRMSAVLAARAPDRLALASARAALPRPDRAALDDPRIAKGLMDTWREAFRTGGEGALSDITIYTQGWGFRLEEIEARVGLWHGSADRNVPASVGAHVARQIPGCHATLVAGAGHVSIFRDNLARILRWLRPGAAGT